MKTENGPPNLDKYLEGRNHRYMSYQEASRLYGLPYWTFVTMAKQAKATWKLRKTAIVDLVKFDKYLEEHCLDNKKPQDESEDMAMPRARKPVENMEELVKSKKKIYVRYTEGAELFSMGLHSFQSLAKDAGAVRKVKGCVLVNLEKIQAFIESFDEEEY